MDQGLFSCQDLQKRYGGDFDEKRIQDNKQRYSNIKNLDFFTLDLLDISDVEKKFDVIVSMAAIEHFEKPDTEIVAENYVALLKDKGFAVIGTPNIASTPFASKRRLKSHLREFEPEEFEEILSHYFRKVFLFSMTDKIVSTQFLKMAWYLMALCVK